MTQPAERINSVPRQKTQTVIQSGWPSEAIRLDAFDAEAGAGGFYARCGFTEVGRVTYRKAPLMYYELLLA